MNIELLNHAAAFVSLEADLLDHCEYAAWLDLWEDSGTYIVPIDPNETDFANTLNYAHDDAAMRRLRVQRLTSGESVSTVPAPRTIRSLSRFRVLADEGGVVTLRCAQILGEFRKDVMKHYTADVTFVLARHGDAFRIRQKVVRLLNATDALACIGYIP